MPSLQSSEQEPGPLRLDLLHKVESSYILWEEFCQQKEEFLLAYTTYAWQTYSSNSAQLAPVMVRPVAVHPVEAAVSESELDGMPE